MIIGIYLAAGKSKRMGCSKLDLPLGSRPLGSIALETALASNLDKILVVTSEKDTLEWVSSQLFQKTYQKKWVHVSCKASWKGQAESLKCGLIAAEKFQAVAIMILLADQPFVTKEMINQIITLYKKEIPKYVASDYNGMLRPPVLFGSRMFPYLFQLQGDQGARRLIRGSNQGLTIKFAEGKSFLDVDTMEQYQLSQKKEASQKFN